MLPPDSALPLATAAAALASQTKAKVVRLPQSEPVKPGDIRLVLGSQLAAYPEAAAQVPESVRAKEWELVQAVGGALVVAGSTPRNVCRAALGWIENPAGETGRLSVYSIEERFTMWDNSMAEEGGPGGGEGAPAESHPGGDRQHPRLDPGFG